MHAETTIKDVVVWTKHVHGDPQLTAKLNTLRGGEQIELSVDGFRGFWRKMNDGRDGRPTNGLRPVGRMQEFWQELYSTRRGEAVRIEFPESEGRDRRMKPVIFPPLAQTREERDAALHALLTAEGRSSEGRSLTRDEMNERW